MKKTILFGLVFIFLSSFAFAQSHGIPMFHDPCNSDLGWQDNSGMTLTFTTVSPINVTSCKFTSGDGKIMSYNLSTKFKNAPGQLETYNVSARFRLDTTNDYSSYMGITSSSTFCHWRDGAMLTLNPSSSDWLRARALGGDINFIPKSLLQTSGTGVRIQWEFNMTTSDSSLMYNLYVNGVKNLTNVRLWKQSCNFTDLNGLGAVTVQTGGNNVIYVDDIRVYNHSAAAPPAPAPLTESITLTFDSSNTETLNSTFTALFKNFNASNASTATLTYHGLPYDGTINFSNTTHISFHSTAAAPLVQSNDTLQNFNWSYNMVRLNGTNASAFTVIKNQSIYWGYYPTKLYSEDSIESETEAVYFDFETASYASLSAYQIEWLGANYTANVINATTARTNITYPTQNQTSKPYNYTGYFNIAFNGTNFTRSISGNNTVHQIVLTNCSSGDLSIDFLLSEERGLYWFDAQTIDLDLTVWSPYGNTSFRRNYDFSYSNTFNASVCISPSFANYNLDAYVINNVEGTYAHRYYTINADINSTPQRANMYNFNSTTGLNTIEVTVVDQYYTPISEVLVKLLRYYPGGGAATTHRDTGINFASSFQTVQMDKTDEFGTSSFQVSDSGDVDYKIIFEQNNSVLRETSVMYLYCSDPADCSVTFQIDTSTIDSIFTLFTDYNWTYDNSTEVVTVQWDDTTQLTDEIQIYVTRETLQGSTQICGQTFTTPSGSFECNTTGYVGSLRVRGFRTASPLKTFLDVSITKSWEDFQYYLNQQGISADGTFWGAAIAMLIVTSAATSILGVILATILALIVIMFMGLTNVVTLTFVTVAVIIAVIVAIRLKQ